MTAKNDIDLLQVVNLQVLKVKSRPNKLDIRFVNISLPRKKSIVSLDAAYLSPWVIVHYFSKITGRSPIKVQILPARA